MNTPSCRIAILALVSLALPLAAVAEPVAYLLDKKASRVGFHFSLSGIPQTGSMPVDHAEITLDPENLAATTVDVTVLATKARTGLFFATEALIGPDVLDTKHYPTIHFVSDHIQLAQDGRLSGGARISGHLTMHGVTHPVTLNADLYRLPGSAPDDLSDLTVLLSGQVSRAAFGATGYADLVDDTIGLDITAVIHAAP